MATDLTKQEAELYKKFKRVSVAEFFEKNRHLLGFDNPKKALLIAVKELVDNSLDACEEAGILPEIKIRVDEIKPSVYRVRVEDNGPGIPEDKIPEIYGSFLFGSKFHRFISTRGKQGIGASAVVLYGQLTTGQPVRVISKVPGKLAVEYVLKINVRNNTPEVIKKQIVDIKKQSGTIVELTLKGHYQKGKQSVDEYIQLTALANPHANIIYVNPRGERYVYKRITTEIPKLYETKPHPHGIEIGVLERMLKETRCGSIVDFLVKDFSSIGKKTALEILKKAKINPKKKPSSLSFEEIERLYEAMQSTKVKAISAKYIVTLGENLIRESLIKMFNPEFVVAKTRKPAVYRGVPFIIEVGIAYGGDITSFRLLRFANRVPLLYKIGDCAITEAVKSINWKRYGLEGKEGEFPSEPIILMVHMASVWIPFTSESKEAIAPYPEIIREIDLALKDALREVSIYINKKRSLSYIGEKYKALYGYGLELSRYLAKILNSPEEEIQAKIVSRIKETLLEDLLDIIETVKDVRELVEEGKHDEARKMLKNMLKDIVRSKIFEQKEINELIDTALTQIAKVKKR
jgi:DNA topoisomerase-6 subunit B